MTNHTDLASLPDPARGAGLASLAGRAAMPAAVRNGGGMQKLNWILDRPAPQEFVRAIATGELYYLMADIGTHDAYPLLELASDEQMQGLLDIDLWTGDTPDLERWLHWLNLANEAGLDTALRLAKVTEPELLQLFFLRDITVHTKDLDTATVPDDLQLLQTPDGEFWVTVPHEHELADRLHGLMRLLWAADHAKMLDVCQTVRFELATPLAELLRNFRIGRLEEMGFAGPEEAAAIYARLDPTRLRREVREALDQLPALLRHPIGTVAEDLALRDATAPTLLGEALAALDDEGRAGVGEAMTFLVHKVLMAWTGDLSQADELPAAGRHATALVNLGLAWASDESPRVATEVLRRVWPERLFRAGYTLTLELARRARLLRHRAGAELGLHLFGSPTDEALQGFARTRPAWYEGLDGEGAVTWRDLSTLAELSRARVMLDDAEAVLDFFETELHFSPGRLLGSDLAELGAGAAELAELRLSTLFRTALAQAMLTDAFAFRPLTRDELLTFLGAVVQRDGDAVAVSPLADRLLARLAEQVAPPVAAWMRDAVEELVLALGRVAAWDLDPRYARELVLVHR